MFNMSNKHFIPTIFCILLIFSGTCTAGLLSIFGSDSSSKLPLKETTGPRSPSQPSYPQESGECSHWGDVRTPPFSTRDPVQVQSPLGIIMPPHDLVGSHKGVPVGSIVSVTNTRNGNTIRVRVVPPKSLPVFGRIMDLSPNAFIQLETLSEGVFPCVVKVVQPPTTTGQFNSLHSYTVDAINKGISPAMTQLGQQGIARPGLLYAPRNTYETSHVSHQPVY